MGTDTDTDTNTDNDTEDRSLCARFVIDRANGQQLDQPDPRYLPWNKQNYSREGGKGETLFTEEWRDG